MQYKLRMEEERTKRETVCETERTKRQEMHLALAKEKEDQDRGLIIELAHMLSANGGIGGLGGAPSSFAPGPSDVRNLSGDASNLAGANDPNLQP